jgi:uncharacterized protein YydD (DUF2326 family)
MRINLKTLTFKQKKEFLKQYSIMMDIAGDSFSNLENIEVSLFEYRKVKKLLSYIKMEKDTTYIVGYKY